MSGASSDSQLDALGERLERWMAEQLDENPVVAHFERDPGERRWFLRVNGEDKDVYSIWFELGQRTLRYETYVMPAPEENEAEFYQHLLRRNHGMYGLSFEVGEEEAVFLAGRIGVEFVDDDELDRILGTIYSTVERCFRPALRVGFASRFQQV